MGNSDDIKSIPEYLTAEEKIYYKWLVEEIELSGVVTNIDKPLLEQVSNIIYILRMADDDIRVNGLMIKSFDKYGNEKMIPNPCLKIKTDMLTKYTSLCGQLPLSPASRASLAARKQSEEQEQDPVLMLLRSGSGA